MTVTNSTARGDYNCNGSTQAFSIPFQFFLNTEIQVLKTDTTVSPAVVTTLALTTDYTVTGGAGSTGTFTTVATFPTGIKLSVLPNLPFTQQAHYVPNDPFPAETHEQALDRLDMQDIQLNEKLGRAAVLPPTVQGVNPSLPAPLANAALVWDPTGTFLTNGASAVASVAAFNGRTGAVVPASSDYPASLIQFTQTGIGAVVSTADAKLKQIVNARDFGAVSDGVTNDSTAVTNTLATVPLAGSNQLPEGRTFVGTARVANQRGVQLTGGMLEYTPSPVLGNRIQNAAGRDRVAWGSEYLYKFLGKFVIGTATTIRLSGDSTTANTGQYSDQLITMLQKFPSVTVTKAGFSGKNTSDWVTTYLAGDIVAAPDVLIWHWGMNDSAAMGQTMAQFEANLRSGLTTYRASIPIGTGGVILMAPNASSDGTNGRDELRNEQMRQIIRNAAADFQCAYIDIYALFQDAYIGIGDWIDNPYADGLRGIHPQTAFAQSIAGEVLDLLIPKGVRRLANEFGVSNSFGSTNPLSTDLPSTYPPGLSIRRATAANGWANDGWVVTFFENTNKAYALQFNYSYADAAQPYSRIYSSGAWQPFNQFLYNQSGTALLSKLGSSVTMQVDGSAAYGRGFAWSTGGVKRSDLVIDNATESGSNAGSNILWRLYTDAGGVIDNLLTAVRAAGGLITVGGTTNRPVTFTGELTTAASVAAHAGFNIPVGVAVTSPVAGDLWNDANGTLNFKGNFGVTGYKSASFGTAVASASAITPTGQIFHITGTTTVNTINLPYTGFTGSIQIIPDAATPFGSSGNIATATVCTLGKTMTMTYDGTKWYPSY